MQFSVYLYFTLSSTFNPTKSIAWSSHKTYTSFSLGLQLRHITAVDMASVDTTTSENKQEPEIVINKNHTRYKQRGKRKWDEPNPNLKENGESDSKIACERIKRKKMAMLLGYSGVNYFGMQRYLLNFFIFLLSYVS